MAIQNSQGLFLRSAMQSLGFTRNEFARQFHIGRHKLDSLLLPSTSKGFRQLSNEQTDQLRNQIASLKEKLSHESSAGGPLCPELPVISMEANSQGLFLRSAMKSLGFTRNKFALQFQISQRNLDAFLLPSTSKGFRQLSNERSVQLRNQIAALQKIMSHEMFAGGLLCQELPGISIEGISFPSLFRMSHKNTSCKVASPEHLPGAEDWFSFSNYTNEPRSTNKPLTPSPPPGTPIAHLDPVQDNNRWLFVRYHQTHQEVLAYINCFSHLSRVFENGNRRDYNLSACVFNGSFFTSLQRPTPPDRPGALVIYETEMLALTQFVMTPKGMLITNPKQVSKLLFSKVK